MSERQLRSQGLTLLKPRGLMVLFGQSSGVVPPFDLGLLARLGSLYVTRPTMGSYIATSSELRKRTDQLFSWTANGELEVVIDRTMHLSEAAAAKDNELEEALTRELMSQRKPRNKPVAKSNLSTTAMAQAE